MNRRRFLGALGGASGSALAGCTETELDFSRNGTPYENPEDRIQFLERQRAVLLYAGGVRMAAGGDRAHPDLKSVVSKSRYTDAEVSVYRGRAAGYYDAAAWNFARAGVVLPNLGDLDAAVGVEACRSARSRAFHLGMGSIYRARATLEARFGGTEKWAPISVLDDGGGRETATPTEDDSNQMSSMGTPVEDDSNQMSNAGQLTYDEADKPAEELAADHFQEASRYRIAPVEDLRRALGLTDG